MLDETIFKKRMDGFRGFLGESGTDFALVTPSPSFQYLTGIHVEMRERLIALLLTADEDPMIVAPSFEVTTLSEQTWLEGFLPWEEDEDPYTLIAERVGQTKDDFTAAFDEDLPLGIYWSVEKAIGGIKKSTSVTPWIDEMRLIKSEEELDLMKKAGRIIDVVVTRTFERAEIGMTEREISQAVHAEVSNQGGDPTFAQVQFAENSALPHIEPGARRLKEGDMVLLDCGCSVDGYNTDQTRMGVVGKPDEDQLEVYQIVLRAQEAALEQIKPGLSCGKADGIARRVIEEAGYAEYFLHRLGHGIGLEVHEPPYLVRGNATELKRGMTHSIEPGIYLEGRFGVRIEDLVCVLEDGCEVITYSPKEFFIIDVS